MTQVPQNYSSNFSHYRTLAVDYYIKLKTPLLSVCFRNDYTQKTLIVINNQSYHFFKSLLVISRCTSVFHSTQAAKHMVALPSSDKFMCIFKK